MHFYKFWPLNFKYIALLNVSIGETCMYVCCDSKRNKFKRHSNAKKCLRGGIVTCDGPSDDVMEGDFDRYTSASKRLWV